MEELKRLINQFWAWSGKTPEQYSEAGGLNQTKGEFEEDFPEFMALYELASSVVFNNILDEDVLNDFLTAMAIDNEGENLAEFVWYYSSYEQLKKVIELGMKHPQSNARWLTTRILEKKKPDGWMDNLKTLSQDTDEYTRRRSRNAINYYLYGEEWDVILGNAFSTKHFIKTSLDQATAECEVCHSKLVGTSCYKSDDNTYHVCEYCYADCKDFFGWFK